MVRMRSGSRLCVQQPRSFRCGHLVGHCPRQMTGGSGHGRPEGLGDRAHSSKAAESRPQGACSSTPRPTQLVHRPRTTPTLPPTEQPASAFALVITDEASPFALRSTRNSSESRYPLVGRRAGVKMGRAARRRRCVLGRWRPCLSLAPGPDSRVAHCCHEHAGQSFGIPTEPPGSPPATRDGRRTVGASRPAGRGRRGPRPLRGAVDGPRPRPAWPGRPEG